MRSIRLWALAAAALLVAAGNAFAQGGKVEVLWLGQSATRITTPGGKVIVIDPWLKTNPKTPAEWKDLGKLGHVDLLLVTHGHGDHVGDVFELAKANNAPVFAPAGLNQSFAELGLLPQELAPRMNKSGTVTPLGPGIKITMVRAEHSSEYAHKDPATGKMRTVLGGEPVGFIIELENGFKIYHMGDTGLFGDMKLIGEYYKPDLVLMPIGGHFVMDPKDAAYATREWLKPKYVLPIHYGTIPQLKGTPEEFKAALGETKVEVLALQPGDSRTF
ncbi:MAG: metal-dependent hydrolase [Rhodospirillales bacterium]|nr:metal-dependent hydrolase [Rhodospirillales bacterium]